MKPDQYSPRTSPPAAERDVQPAPKRQRFDPDDKRVARAVLDGLILKHQAKRLAIASSDA